MPPRVFRWTAGTLFVVGLAAPAAAAVIHEEVNAPAIFDGVIAPEAVEGGIDQTHGSIGGSDEGDLYRVYFSSDGELRLRGRTTSGGIDPTLFVFDSEGRGLFAIANGGPTNAVWDALRLPGGGPPAGFGVLDRLRNTGLFITPGNYRIDFLSMATGEDPTVPEPAVSSLLCCGLMLGGLRRLRRRRRRDRGPRHG